jgi:hypothetical protein
MTSATRRNSNISSVLGAFHIQGFNSMVSSSLSEDDDDSQQEESSSELAR